MSCIWITQKLCYVQQKGMLFYMASALFASLQLVLVTHLTRRLACQQDATRKKKKQKQKYRRRRIYPIAPCFSHRTIREKENAMQTCIGRGWCELAKQSKERKPHQLMENPQEINAIAMPTLWISGVKRLNGRSTGMQAARKTEGVRIRGKPLLG
ncbi:hypothetical protein COCVIDRAFT_95012 [Bipolaris victoriae FI3]|uniref:Uncharacterized protein n=1 Tax=Bipolaris victoriae (strain FI3) TaxID=930091 RepID=W7EX96_BIPV3|nr:hypothetical protein COCVIDRAFT_95012 [Bipolaris victoriae FI3]